MKFTKLYEEVMSSKREGIKHFNLLKPLEFIDFMKDVESSGGKIKSGTGNFTEKIDGFGFRFGVFKGKFFVESSRSGAVFEPGKFLAFAQSKGQDTTISQGYENIFKVLSENKALVNILNSNDIGNGLKVVCECLYTPFGKPGSGNEIEFIATKYDKTQLGSQATFILFTVTEGPDFTKTAPNSSKIIDEIQKASTDTIKFSKLPAMKNAEIDLTAYVGSMKELIKEYDDVNSVLTARKQADLVTRRDLEAKLEDLKKKTETRILSGLQQKGNFGQEYEGSVLKMPSGKLYKFISPRFKEQKFGSQGKK